MVKEKKCYRCGKVKSAKEFGKDKRVPGGLKSKCSACQTEYDRVYHQENKERLNEASRKYHREHAKEISERNKKYVEEHKEEISAKGKAYRRREDVKKRRVVYMRQQRIEKREYYSEVAKRSYYKNKEKKLKGSREEYEKNKEKRKEYARDYRRQNPEKILKNNRERKIRQLEILGCHTLEQWIQLCGFFKGVCPCCNEKRKLTVDHIVPLSWENATDWITNIQPLCKSCNSKKHDVNATDYRPEHVRIWAQEQKDLMNDDS